jgi:hypothetical protein
MPPPAILSKILKCETFWPISGMGLSHAIAHDLQQKKQNATDC